MLGPRCWSSAGRTCCSFPSYSSLFLLHIWSCFVVQAGLDLTIVAQDGFQTPHPPASSSECWGHYCSWKLLQKVGRALLYLIPYQLCVNNHIGMKGTDDTQFLHLNGWLCLDRRFKEKCSFKNKLNWFEMSLGVKENILQRKEPEQNNRGKNSLGSRAQAGRVKSRPVFEVLMLVSVFASCSPGSQPSGR